MPLRRPTARYARDQGSASVSRSVTPAAAWRAATGAPSPVRPAFVRRSRSLSARGILVSRLLDSRHNNCTTSRRFGASRGMFHHVWVKERHGNHESNDQRGSVMASVTPDVCTWFFSVWRQSTGETKPSVLLSPSDRALAPSVASPRRRRPAARAPTPNTRRYQGCRRWDSGGSVLARFVP